MTRQVNRTAAVDCGWRSTAANTSAWHPPSPAHPRAVTPDLQIERSGPATDRDRDGHGYCRGRLQPGGIPARGGDRRTIRARHLEITGQEAEGWGAVRQAERQGHVNGALRGGPIHAGRERLHHQALAEDVLRCRGAGTVRASTDGKPSLDATSQPASCSVWASGTRNDSWIASVIGSVVVGCQRLPSARISVFVPRWPGESPAPPTSARAGWSPGRCPAPRSPPA
jgi:hypothetical protein